MNISARVENARGEHRVTVRTDGHSKAVAIPPKPDGFGSAVNGGELLFVALATCYCNDLYREASRRGLAIDGVEVEVDGEFGGVGEPARNIEYRVRVQSAAPREEILALIQLTDTVAEIHNTLRQASTVRLVQGDASI